MGSYTNVSNNREKIIGIMADVTGCSTKKIWGGTKIEKVFDPLGDDALYRYFDFCSRLEKEFNIALSDDEMVAILPETLLGLELRISKKLPAQKA